MAISDNPREISRTGAAPTPALALHASPKLTVIVPVYNGRKHIASCLEGLLASEYSDFEVIVVDDGSTDDTRLIVEQYPVYCLRTPRTLGPAGARNMGIGYAQASVVVFVDADVVLPPNALGIIANEFDSDPQMAAMFGSYDDEPMWRDFCSQYKNLMHSFVHQNSNVRATTFWAGCGAIRREIFMHIGGFDHSRYRKPSIEDIELGYR
ncbi:MAG: glycosyltransferase family 2 protein, partial [Terracidiphilus sp.]